MSERLILFSGPMVRAILEGRKTQTRRVISIQPTFAYSFSEWVVDPTLSARFENNAPPLGMLTLRCPYGGPGDTLWVRETWAQVWKQDGCLHDGMDDEKQCPCGGCRLEYRADTGNKYPGDWPDDRGDDESCGRRRPSIHMPRWAGRIVLRVAAVRVRRLQDLREEEAVAEGTKGCLARTSKQSYADLWDELNAKRGYPWESNPWVWAITFSHIER